MVYKWRDASRIKADAEKAGEYMRQLEEEGRLNAQTIVDESRPQNSLLHNEFEWNDKTAANQYRLQQARHIMNCIVVMDEQTETSVRAFFNIQEETAEYKSIFKIMSSDDMMNELEKQALSELIAFQKKYEGIKKFKELFKEISKLTA